MASSRGRSMTYDEGPEESLTHPLKGVDKFSPDSILGYIAMHSDELQRLREQVQLLIDAIDPILLPDRPGEAMCAPGEDRPELSHVASMIDDNISAVRYLQRQIVSVRERIQF